MSKEVNDSEQNNENSENSAENSTEESRSAPEQAPIDNQTSERIKNIARQAKASSEARRPKTGQASEEIIQYQEDIAKLKDQVLRVAAEKENEKRRAERDMEKAKFFSIEAFARDAIDVLENLYRASDAISDESASTNEELKSAKDGIEITKKELLTVFQRHYIERVYPKGQIFDHNLHQAVSQLPNNDVEVNTVLEVVQAGYTLKGRLLTPAMVVVSKKDD